MSRFLKYFAIALLAFLICLPIASAQRRGFGRGFGFRGPGWGWYGPYSYGWYGPYGYGWYYPYGRGWGYPYDYSPATPTGNVKITKVPNDTQVYIDRSNAGTVAELKKFRLRTGDHDIELRDRNSHVFYKERIYVVPGKTIEVHGDTGGH